MADVKTESLKPVDNASTKSIANISNEKMTVEKQLGQPIASKNKNTNTVKENSDEGPLVSPAQLKVASGNNAPSSPKKSDSKNSPTSKSPSSVQPKTTPVQQQGKNKVNPWHKNSATTGSSGGAVAKKASAVAPEGTEKAGSNSGSSSPKEDPSKSIKIPGDEVCHMVTA